MTIDVDELERLANAATPGPWATNLVRKRDVVEATKEEPAIVVSNFIEDAAFIAAVNPAVVLALIERLRAAEAIVRDLAEGGDPISPGIAACAVCRAWQPGAEPMKLIDHDEDCAYRRAVEYVK